MVSTSAASRRWTGLDPVSKTPCVCLGSPQRSVEALCHGRAAADAAWVEQWTERFAATCGASTYPWWYQSLHTTVRAPDAHAFEVQIRSMAMHRHCENGDAAHWRDRADDRAVSEALGRAIT